MFGYSVGIYTCCITYLDTMPCTCAYVNIVISRACLHQLQLRCFLQDIVADQDVFGNNYLSIW